MVVPSNGCKTRERERLRLKGKKKKKKKKLTKYYLGPWAGKAIYESGKSWHVGCGSGFQLRMFDLVVLATKTDTRHTLRFDFSFCCEGPHLFFYLLPVCLFLCS